MAAMPVSDKKQKTTFALNETADLQKSMLEEKLEALLENVDGVGKVQVILMTDEKKDGQSFYNSGYDTGDRRSDLGRRRWRSCGDTGDSGGSNGIISGGCS